MTIRNKWRVLCVFLWALLLEPTAPGKGVKECRRAAQRPPCSLSPTAPYVFPLPEEFHTQLPRCIPEATAQHLPPSWPSPLRSAWPSTLRDCSIVEVLVPHPGSLHCSRPILLKNRHKECPTVHTSEVTTQGPGSPDCFRVICG